MITTSNRQARTNRVPRQILRRKGGQLLALALITVASTSFAADGTWTNDLGGLWSTAVNWNNSNIADGAGSTANFNTRDLLTPITVNLDSARTVGTLLFGDTDTNTPNGWLLANNAVAANTLTTTNITVNPISAPNSELATNDAIISAVITGTSFVKKGGGTLTLAGANTMAPIRIDEGDVAVANATALGAGNQKVSLNGGGIRIATTAALGNTNEFLTTGHLYPPTVNYDAYNGPWTGPSSATIFIHATSTRFTPFNGNVNGLSGFSGTIDFQDSAGGLVRWNLGSGNLYDCSAITFNLGTNSGRMAPRMTAAPGTFRIGALSGGPNTRCESSEQGTGTLTTWEIGALNTSTLFEGQFRNYNNTVGRLGVLKKVGSGKLTLTGSTHAYAGNTIVSQGTLALSNSAAITTTPVITVQNGATFDVSGLATPFALVANQVLAGSGVVTGAVSMTTGTIIPGEPVGPLTFNGNATFDGASAVTNLFDIASSITYDTIQVNGDLTYVAGSVTAIRVVPTGPVIPNGTYQLIKWTGNLSGDVSNLALEYPTQPGTLALSVNLGAKAIVLTVSGVPSAGNLVWKGNGVGNDWDMSSANWLSSGSPSLFSNGDNVTFNDVGSNNVPVNIATVVNPASITVNATKDYILASTGSGYITGSGGILKTNSGKLTLLTDNDYTGPTVIANGTLQVGDGVSMTGSLGTGNVTNNSALVFFRTLDRTNSSNISGTGTLTQQGLNILTLSGANTYTGTTTISAGTLALAAGTAIGTGTINMAGGTLSVGNINLNNAFNITADSTIASSGTLQLNTTTMGGSAGTYFLTGTIRFNTAGLTVNRPVDIANTMQSYNVTGDQIFNGVISGAGVYQRRWSDSSPSNTGRTIMNALNTYSGGTLLREGSIGFGINSVSATPPTVDSGPIGTGPLNQDNATYTAVFASGAARNVGNPIVLNTAGGAFVISGSFDLTLSGTMDLAASTKVIQVDNTAKSILTGDVSNGDLIKSGNGVLYINGNNFCNSTTVSNGTLGGIGSFSGPVTVLPGATLAPGASIGTLTITSDLTINGNLAIEVNKSVSPSNDLITVSGSLTNGGTGTVNVSNLGPALSIGDRFYLFDKALTNGNAMTITGGGVGWVNRLAIDGSIQAAAPGIATNPTNITFSVGGGNLTLSWPADHKGWSLQAQTNSLSAGLKNGTWVTISGYEATNSAVIPITPGNPTVFYRLFYLAP